VDILTPAEFAKSLEILEGTVKPIEGVTDEMLDRMGALGMISVFDIEEVGSGVLIEELGMDDELAERVIDACSSQAKIVAEQQQKEKEEAEKRRAEEMAVGAALLGGGGEAPVVPDEQAESAADSILGGDDEDASEAASEPASASRSPRSGE
jgi:N utilization substance protein A